MKGLKMEKLSRKYLLPSLPGWNTHRSLIFAQPIKHILAGLYFDSSGFDSAVFYPTVFVQPLYVLQSHLTFVFGWRLKRSNEQWRISSFNETDIMMELGGLIRAIGIPYIEKLNSPTKLALNAQKISENSTDPYVLQAVAYSWILEGEKEKGVKFLDQLCVRLEGNNTPWCQEMFQQTKEFRRTTADSLAKAQNQLEEWANQTTVNLRLSRYRAVTNQAAEV